MTGTKHLHVHPANGEQASAWDGDEGAYWAAHADRFDRAIAAYHEPFLDAARLSAGDRVLDIGCGTGQTTRDAARTSVDGFAVGVDLSEAMIAYARRRALEEQVPNAQFEQADAQIHPFPDAGFDVAISRTGAMFFGDPVAAFTNIARALRRRGRLVLLTWRAPQDNAWFTALTGALLAGRPMAIPPSDAPGPFSLSDPNRVRGILGDSGFTRITIDPLAGPMWFGVDADDATEFILGLLGWMLADLDGDRRAHAVDAMRATVAAHETSDGVSFGSGTWLVTARRG
jgi:SAM-dependent methyltransferase